MDETFLLSNIAPQVGDGFNRHCECVSAGWGVVVLTMRQTGRTSKTGAGVLRARSLTSMCLPSRCTSRTGTQMENGAW